MFKSIAEAVLKYRLPILILFAVLTVFMGWQAKDVRMSYKLAQMLPETDSAYIKYQDFKKTFGEDGSVIIIGNKESKFFELNYFKKYQSLSADIKQIKGVKNIVSVADAVTFERNDSLHKFVVRKLLASAPKTQSDVDSVKHQLYSLPFYEDLIYNRHEEVYLMMITLTKDVLNSKERMTVVNLIDEKVKTFADQNQTEMHISGLPYIRAINMMKAKKELTMFTLLAALVTAIILFIIFKSFYEVVFPVIIVLIGAVWAQGILVLMGYEITILTGLIPPLLIVIGIPNAIYVINKYHQEYNKTEDQNKALVNVIAKTGSAIFLTNLTTAIGFATFIITRSNVLKEFGYVTSVNVMLLFVISLVLIPIVYSYLPPPSLKARKHLDTRLATAVVRLFIIISQHYRKAVYLSTFLVVIFSIYGITKIKARASIVDDLKEDEPVLIDLKFFERNFGGVMPFEISIDTKQPKNVTTSSRTWKKMDELQEYLDAKEVFSKPLSIIELIKFSNQAFYRGDPESYELPSSFDRAFIVDYIKKEQGRDTLLNNFIDSSKQTARISVQMANLPTNEIQEVKDDVTRKVNEIFPPEDYNVSVTGAAIAFLEGSKYLVKNLLMSVVLAIFIIAFFMALMFKKFKIVVISLVPNLIPLLFTAGLMGYFGIPLKPSTVLVFSIAFGISVDDTIHYLAKLRQELKVHDNNMRASVVTALRETGLSMVYTSVILFFGFSVFAWSDFGGTVALGTLVSFTLLSAMFTNLILLPALLMSTHEHKGKKENRIRTKERNKRNLNE